MTDKELLERAAKAAGRVWLSYHHTKGLCCRDDSFGGLIEYYWNPLTDDGDALRLAAMLNMNVNIHKTRTATTTAEFFGEVFHDGNPFAGTRRAIVRAAAAIGKAME